MIELINQFYQDITTTINNAEEPWTNILLAQAGIKRMTPPQEKSAFKILLTNPMIHSLLTKLETQNEDLVHFETKLPDHANYSSFYWILNFLADIGLNGEELNLKPIITKFFLIQNEDGLFTTGYRRRSKLPISLFCISAHLTSILIRLGYGNTPNIKAAIRFIVTAQRPDGSWHCVVSKQRGERDENSPGCMTANIFALRALGSFGHGFEKKIVAAAFEQILDGFFRGDPCCPCCDLEYAAISHKLRYPAHYLGLDYLHVLDTLSLYPEWCAGRKFEEFIALLLKKKTISRLLVSEKTIPSWKEFDFARTNSASSWITAIACRALQRIYKL